MRAQGLPQETVLYGLEEEEEEEEAFEIDLSSGRITVGPAGPDLLVIVCFLSLSRTRRMTINAHAQEGAPLSVTFTVFAYYESAGPNGNKVGQNNSRYLIKH